MRQTPQEFAETVLSAIDGSQDALIITLGLDGTLNIVSSVEDRVRVAAMLTEAATTVLMDAQDTVAFDIQTVGNA